MIRFAPWPTAGVLALAALVACGNKSAPPQPAPKPASPPAAPPEAAPQPSAKVALDGGAPVNKGVEFTENDFVENDRSRDPFRSFLITDTKGPRIGGQHDVKLAEYALDDLRLVAIVMAGDGARAMFKDPRGVGHVIKRGMYLCRPELVRLGGATGPEYELNWRVDRIRDGEVVLIREDQAQPQIPPATKVIPLHPQEQKQPG